MPHEVSFSACPNLVTRMLGSAHPPEPSRVISKLLDPLLRTRPEAELFHSILTALTLASHLWRIAAAATATFPRLLCTNMNKIPRDTIFVMTARLTFQLGLG